MQEASKQFYDLLNEYLLSIGFKPTKADPCLFVHKHPHHGLTFAAVHVDDILLISPNEHQRTWVENTIKKRFKIKTQHDNISYLGMAVTRDPSTNHISIIVKQHEVTWFAKQVKLTKMGKKKNKKKKNLSNSIFLCHRSAMSIQIGMETSNIIVLCYVLKEF
jgi:hypothetical protein